MDIVRAWKDADYRMSLTQEQLAQLPENPVGAVELSDEQLQGAGGVAAQSASFYSCPTKSICSYCDCI
ncbi:mersacidin/lichenicidin family type 2 lantibiotic [Archangium violaceum]|uniref:mersacidin/lichenicidin family type 2 lantibiotic n=1 Tax=Archangium violaceum TaxID=83451 RepID=UPI00193B56B7|nr:mersacidin/lichenicidin family type 2 lantibiotic [Archangium violaceum]QRK04684.1 mersacidin/lichenicidin family type 2 lantibiotic [Archangium violaceum]